MDNRICVFQKGEVIFKEGAYERCMYTIMSGSVSIYAGYGMENEKLLTVLESGRFFGEIGIAEALPRTATAVAAEDDTRLVEITAEQFGDYFKNEPQKLLAIMRNMSGRLRSLTHDYLEAREAISEAADNAGKGAVRSAGLAAKIAKLVQNSIRPSFLKSGSFDEAAFMNSCAEKAYVVKTFGKNEVIFREGDASNCMYDIRWGSVGIYANYGAENQKLLVQLMPEAFFGEMGLLENMPRSATAVAMEAGTKVCLVSADMFASYLEEQPEKVLMVLMHLSSRIRALTKDYMEVCRLAAEASAEEENPSAGPDRKNRWAYILAESFVEALSTPSDPADCYYSRHYE